MKEESLGLWLYNGRAYIIESIREYQSGGGKVRLMRVVGEDGKRFFVATYVGDNGEVVYGLGTTRKETLLQASKKWKEEGRQGDPFAWIWRRIKEGSKPAIDAKTLDVMTKLAELKMQLITEAIKNGCTVFLGSERRKMYHAKPVTHVGFRNTLLGVVRTRVEVTFENGKTRVFKLPSFLEVPISIVCGHVE